MKGVSNMSPPTSEPSIADICDHTWKPLYQYIYYKVQNREEAEDIVQETYVRAIPYLQKGKVNSDKYINFLKTVALNVIRDLWRKQKRKGFPVTIDSFEISSEQEDSPEQISMGRLFIEKALYELNENERAIIELRIIRGYSVRDTAKILNKTESAIKVAQHRALKKLSEKLKTQSWEA